MKKKSPFVDLLKDETMSKDSYLFNIEHSRTPKDQLFLKLEVFNSKEVVVFKLKMQIDDNENLRNIAKGKSINKVGFISLSSQNFFKSLKDGVDNAISEGRIPFLP